MSEAARDQNYVPAALGQSSTSATTTLPFKIDSTTGRLLVDSASGLGTVTSVSVVTANGFAGTVATATTTPAITLTTTITGLLKGNGTAISAATAGTDYVTSSSTNTFTNKTYDTAGTGNAFAINGTSITAVTGTGAVVLANTPTLITPVLGVATATSINGLTITSSTGTLTITNGKVVSFAKTLSFDGTDSTTMTFPSTSATIARTDAANTFSGNQTFSGTVILGTQSITMTGSIAATGARVTKVWTADIESTNMPTVGGVAILTSLTAPQFTTIELGNASDTTLSRSSGGVLAVEGVVIPSISSTNTLTNKRVTPRILSAASYTTDTGSSINGDTQDMFIVTAQTGALKFNNPSGTPTDGQKLILSVASSTTSARALTWDTGYGSTTVTLPTTTAATTATLTIGFIWSASKSLWQCVAVA